MNIKDNFKSIVASRGTMLFFVGVYVCGFAAYSFLPPDRTASTVLFLWIHSIHAFCGMICVMLLQRHYSALPPTWALLLIFFLPRLLVSPMQPWLSDDALRYLWDGFALLNGVNPYITAPNAPQASSLRALQPELFAMLDYTAVTSIYPPLAEYVFAGGVWLGKLINTGVWQAGYVVWKIVLIASEGAGLFLLHKALGRMNASYLPLLVYCFLPLPVIELAGQAHVDGLLCLPLGAICFVLTKGQNSMGYKPLHILILGGCVATLGGIKILPAIVLFPVFRHVARKPQAIHNFTLILASCAGVAFILMFPLLSEIAVMVHFADIARNNALYWQFNGAPYYALCYVCAYLQLPTYWLCMPFVFSYLRIGVVLLTAILPKASNDKIFQAMLITLCAVLLFSPKVHTWYFVALLFVNILVGWKWLPVFASASVLSYAYYAVQPAQEQYWVEMCVWGASLLIAVWEWRRRHVEIKL